MFELIHKPLRLVVRLRMELWRANVSDGAVFAELRALGVPLSVTSISGQPNLLKISHNRCFGCRAVHKEHSGSFTVGVDNNEKALDVDRTCEVDVYTDNMVF